MGLEGLDGWTRQDMGMSLHWDGVDDMGLREP